MQIIFTNECKLYTVYSFPVDDEWNEEEQEERGRAGKLTGILSTTI